MMAGEHCIRGFSNADIRTRLDGSSHLLDLADDLKHQSAKISRILNRFHVHKLIAKIPHTRRWSVTDRGRQIMATSLRMREVTFPDLYSKTAAA
jgi:DNA-binding MarR family transcriptional regulator